MHLKLTINGTAFTVATVRIVGNSEVISEPSFLDGGSAPALLRLAVQKRRCGKFGPERSRIGIKTVGGMSAKAGGGLA